MAAALLRFRRGTSIPTTLDISEPFWDETNDVLIIGTTNGGGTEYISLAKLNDSNNGSFSLTGNITASNASFSGTVSITNDIIIGGSIILGDNPVDEIALNGVLSGSMIPSADSTFNIGAPSAKWNTVYADTAVFTNFTASAVEYTDVLNKPTLISGSSQVDHNSTSNYLGVEHVNHSTTLISAGNGLSGGGSIDTTRTLTLDTGSTHFTDGVSAIAPTLPSGLISGSSQLTSSYDTRYELQGNNIVSGSSQLTSSYDTRYELQGNNIVSGSSQLTSSYDTRYEIQGNGIISGSSQLNSTVINGLQLTNVIATGSFSGSIDGGGIGQNLLLDDGTLASTASVAAGGLPDGVVSGSSQLTSSYDQRYELSGSASPLPSDVVSGSSQLTSSYDVRYELQGSGIFSGSSQVDFFGVSNLPNGLVSGSSQLTSSYDTRYSLSGSYVTKIGTRSQNEVAVWNGDGTLSGSGNFTYDGTDISILKTNEFQATRLLETAGDTLGAYYGYDGATNTLEIGTHTVSDALRVNDVAAILISRGSTTVQFLGNITVSGSIEATGEITAFAASDERLKNNIQLIKNPLEKIQLLRGITWEWNEDTDESQKKSSTMGVSAQDMEKALPELVRTRDNGYLVVDYPKIVGLLIETNKELLQKIETLEKRMDNYDADNTALKGRD